jgi:hypothetical protein
MLSQKTGGKTLQGVQTCYEAMALRECGLGTRGQSVNRKREVQGRPVGVDSA